MHDSSDNSILVLHRQSNERVFKVCDIASGDNFLFDGKGRLFIQHVDEAGDYAPVVTVLNCRSKVILKARQLVNTLVEDSALFTLGKNFAAEGIFVSEFFHDGKRQSPSLIDYSLINSLR